MAYPKYSFLIAVATDGTTTTTKYDSKALAQAAEATAKSQGKDTYLYLDILPAQSVVAPKTEGIWTDEYGVQKEIGTGQRIIQIPAGTVLHTYGESSTIFAIGGQSYTGNFTRVQIVADGNGGTTVTRTENVGGFFFPEGYVFGVSSYYVTLNWEHGSSGGTWNYGSMTTATVSNGIGGTRETGETYAQPYGTIINSYIENNLEYLLRFNGVTGTYTETRQVPSDGGGGGGDGDQNNLTEPIYYNTPAGDLVVGSRNYSIVSGMEVTNSTTYVPYGTSLAIHSDNEYFSNGEGGVYVMPWLPPPPPDEEDEEYPYYINGGESENEDTSTEQSNDTPDDRLFAEDGSEIPYETILPDGTYLFSPNSGQNGSFIPEGAFRPNTYGGIYYLSRTARTASNQIEIPTIGGVQGRSGTQVKITGKTTSEPSSPTTYNHPQVGWTYHGRARWLGAQNRYIDETMHPMGRNNDYPSGLVGSRDVAVFQAGEKCPTVNPTVYVPREIDEATDPKAKWRFDNVTNLSFYSLGDGTAELR